MLSTLVLSNENRLPAFAGGSPTSISGGEDVTAAQNADKANIDELDAYAREAAETMAVGKDEWAKMG